MEWEWVMPEDKGSFIQKMTSKQFVKNKLLVYQPKTETRRKHATRLKDKIPIHAPARNLFRMRWDGLSNDAHDLPNRT